MVELIEGRSIHGILQAGGLGTRIRPLGNRIPKAMLAVDGVPMVERLLFQMLESGIRKITIVVGYQGDTIVNYLQSRVHDFPSDTTLSFLEEAEPLGNAGALGRIDTEGGPALLAFADLVTAFNFAEMIRLHDRRSCDATLASHYEEHSLRLGEIVADGTTVKNYVEKPTKRFLICSGIGLFEAEAMQVARKLNVPYGISDLVRCILASGMHVTHWVHGAFWMDVNTPEALEVANAAAKREG